MVDSVKRRLRDGVMSGEQPPAIMVRDTVTTTGGPPLLRHFLRSECDNVSRGLSQGQGVVVVALSESPESYTNLLHAELTSRGHPPTSFRVLDCYTDPLGWEGKSTEPGSWTGNDNEDSHAVYRNIRSMDGLSSLILELGLDSVEARSSARFTVFFDSVSVLLRYHSLTMVMLLLSALRCHDQVAGLCWLIHADLHEPQITKSFEYVSSVTVAVEPYTDAEGERVEGGLVRVRQKRRNGRVREQAERFYFSARGLSFGPVEKFEPVESGSGKVTVATKVQFNLALTEKELEDRSKVILPFEHQGNGLEGKIYDGRANIKMSYLASQARTLAVSEAADSSKQGKISGAGESTKKSHLSPEARELAPVDDDDEPESAVLGTGLGEIHYLRDSDDERPDSDEDPDDDLDI